jgi:DNA polymerase III delta prime subunit
MIPIILVASNLRKVNSFVDNLANDRKISENHIYKILPKTKEFSIDQIREIKKEIIYSLTEERIFILYDFQSSSLEAQNAFLKTLEEAPDKIQFILVVDSQHRLIPTIVSRSKIIILDKNKPSIVNKDTQIFIDSLIKDHSLKIFSLEYNDLIDQLVVYFKEKMAKDPKAAKVLKEIIKVNALIKSNNLDPRLATDHLLIFIHSIYSIN